MTPKHVLKAIQSCIKEEEHFWHFRDEVMSDFRQQPEEQIHALNIRITTMVNNCAFKTSKQRYHKANAVTACCKIPQSLMTG